MNEHLLDRPIWTSLGTRHAGFAVGNGLARRYPSDISPLAATRDASDECQAALREIVQNVGSAIITQKSGLVVPDGTCAAWDRELAQMTFDGSDAVDPSHSAIVALGDQDAGEMLALARLTEPGPFEARTHKLGQFWGIRQEGRLVAMAGERMQQPGFAEISGVCTDPVHRGKGFGSALCRQVCRAILRRGETPYLHVFQDNQTAIQVYEALGFRRRETLRAIGLVLA